jgi:hypothetical protein
MKRVYKMGKSLRSDYLPDIRETAYLHLFLCNQIITDRQQNQEECRKTDNVAALE